MNLRLKMTAAAALAAISMSATANVTIPFPEYTLTFGDDTVFGGLSFNGSSSGGQFFFGWNIPTLVQVSSNSATMAAADFTLPSWTITPAPGYTLSGPISAFMGNLAYAEVGAGASTAASASGTFVVNGFIPVAVSEPLDKTTTVSLPGFLESGYYSRTIAAPGGEFSSLGFSGNLHLEAASGAVYSQDQSFIQFSFQAAPVPEPETYALMLAGLGTVLMLARRRRAD